MRTGKTNVIKDAQKVIDSTIKRLRETDEAPKPVRKKVSKESIVWDIPLEAEVSFFDADLSYELSGYRPITKDKGLDFRPEWFTEARDEFLRTGHYTSYLPGSKGYRDFWHEEYRRCRKGYTVNGYTVTGEHYFFLNYYQLPIVDGQAKAGSGRMTGFPHFMVSQYQFFHYVDLAKKLHKHIALMKARSVGFSEISASMTANQYTTVRESITMVACYDKGKLDRTLSKVWNALRFLDTHTDGGMFKLRQLSDTAYVKKSGHFNMSRGNRTPAGWQSMIEGVVADDPQKIRGDRVDLMVLDEAGCHAAGTEVFMYDGSLKKVEDIVVGDIVMGDDGTPRTVLELHSGVDQMYKITPRAGDVQIVNSQHIIYGKHRDYNRGTYEPFEIKAEDYYNMLQKHPRRRDGYKLLHSTSVSFPHQDVPIDPYLFGFWLGDGDAAQARFTSMDPEIIQYLQEYADVNNYKLRIEDCTNSHNCKHLHLTTEKGKPNYFIRTLKELGVFNNKDIPECYIKNDRETLLQVLAGLIDSDGTYNPKQHTFEITQYDGHKNIIDKAELICRILGLRIKRASRYSKERKFRDRLIKGGVLQHRLRILYGHSAIPCKIKRKQSTDRDGLKPKSAHDRYDTTFKIEKAGIDKYYGFSLDGNQLFLLKDFTVCHNSWPMLLKAFVQAQALVEVQGTSFGSISLGGTG